MKTAFATLVCLILMSGCRLDSIVNNEELPPDVRDPALTRTPEGAIAAYFGSRAQFARAFGGSSGFIKFGGLLGDELQSGGVGGTDVLSLETSEAVDVRQVPETPNGNVGDISAVYSTLQKARAQLGQAIGLLTHFAPDSLQALTGHIYAVQGYTEVFLAELFCSGVPLSTIDFDGDFTLRAGSSTEDVYVAAVAHFDTALTLAGDSSRFAQLARVGKARALLGLGEFAEAAMIAAEVPDNYRYEATFTRDPRVGSCGSTTVSCALTNFARIPGPSSARWSLTVADREGVTGLNYRTSNDPRTRVTARGNNLSGVTIFHPNKYATTGASPIVVASGVEARLIEAEAALRVGGTWLERLNALRTNGTFTTTPNATDPTRTDTLWNAGIGGVAALRPLEDPGTPESRVDLVFRERAFWLFLTGQRQGDLRRLMRQYARPMESVYPSGAYPGGHQYGGDVTLPIPQQERVLNRSFTGCISRGA